MFLSLRDDSHTKLLVVCMPCAVSVAVAHECEFTNGLEIGALQGHSFVHHVRRRSPTAFEARPAAKSTTALADAALPVPSA